MSDNYQLAKSQSNKNMTALHAEMVKLNPAYVLEEHGYYGLAITLNDGDHSVTLYAEHCGRGWSGPLTTYLRVKTSDYNVAYKHNATFSTKNLVTKFHNMMEDFMHTLKENKKAREESQAKDRAAIAQFKQIWGDQIRTAKEGEYEWMYGVSTHQHEVHSTLTVGEKKDLKVRFNVEKDTYTFEVDGVTKDQTDRIIAILKEGQPEPK